MWIPQGEEKRKQWWKMSTSLHTCLVFPFRGPHPLPSLPLLCITFLSINSFHVLSNGTSVPPLDMSTPSTLDLSGFISKHLTCAVPLMYALLTISVLIEGGVILHLIKKTNRKEKHSPTHRKIFV